MSISVALSPLRLAKIEYKSARRELERQQGRLMTRAAALAQLKITLAERRKRLADVRAQSREDWAHNVREGIDSIEYDIENAEAAIVLNRRDLELAETRYKAATKALAKLKPETEEES